MTEADVTAFSPETFELPDYTALKRLYCMNGGFHLQILQDGTASGTREENIYSILRVKATSPGVVVIEGTETGQYLAMNEDGKLYGSTSVTDESYFLERIEENHYNTYKSRTHGENWYVGIKKNGKMKLGPRTHVGQKAVFFLPRQVDQIEESFRIVLHDIVFRQGTRQQVVLCGAFLSALTGLVILL